MTGARQQQPPKAASPPEMRFFEGLAWAVPTAFAAALSALRFEQGDVLYEDRRAYAPLTKKVPKGLTAIQVQLPKRSARATPSEFEGDRRAASWQSEATIELHDLAAGESRMLVVSQGKLAMTIITGDEG